MSRLFILILLTIVASQTWGIGVILSETYDYDANVHIYFHQNSESKVQNNNYYARLNPFKPVVDHQAESTDEKPHAGGFFALLVDFLVTKNGGQTFERVVSNAELKATQQSGLLRGGREGENFFTNSASLNAKRAQQRLGLDGLLRDARIRFRVKNNVEVTGPRPAAPGRTGTAGGGREFSTKGRTEIEILRVDRLKK